MSSDTEIKRVGLRNLLSDLMSLMSLTFGGGISPKTATKIAFEIGDYNLAYLLRKYDD